MSAVNTPLTRQHIPTGHPRVVGRRFDLHVHTNRSDGRYSPEDVIERCFEGGLDVIAITDHDLATPLATGRYVRGDREMTVIGGAEISGQHEGEEFHLLVYFPNAIPHPFREFCQAQARARADRFRVAADNLSLPESIYPGEQALRGDQALTRHHLARHLVEHGHARDLRDAFSRYIAHSHGNVPSIQLPFVEAIREARVHGGVTSWAHPPTRPLHRYLDTFVRAGLQGLEGYRPRMSAKQRKAVRSRARQRGLFITGGSDWHGWREPRPGLFWVERHDLSGFLNALEAAA